MTDTEREIVMAAMDVEAAEIARSAAADRLNAAVVAGKATGLSWAHMGRLAGKDRSTIQHRMERAT